MWNKLRNSFKFSKNPKDTLPRGVLLDNTTLHIVGLGIFEKKFDQFAEISLFDLVESLILHEHIWVEKSIFNIDKFAQKVAQITEDVISPIEISDKAVMTIYKGMLEYYDDKDIISNLGEFDIAEPLGFWNDNYHLYNVNFKQIEDPLFEHLRTHELDFQPDYYTYFKIRTFFYFFLAQYLGLPYVPNSFRVPILLRFLRNQKNYYPLNSFALIALKKTEQTFQSMSDYINTNLEGDIIQIQLPILKNVLPFNSSNPEKTIEAALKLRETSEAISFRQWCTRLDKSLIEGNIPELYRGLNELEELQKNLLALSGPKKKSFTITIGFPPSVQIDLKIPILRKRYLLFLRNIFERAINTRKRGP
jgi:hypothetical protein